MSLLIKHLFKPQHEPTLCWNSFEIILFMQLTNRWQQRYISWLTRGRSLSSFSLELLFIYYWRDGSKNANLLISTLSVTSSITALISIFTEVKSLAITLNKNELGSWLLVNSLSHGMHLSSSAGLFRFIFWMVRNGMKDSCTALGLSEGNWSTCWEQTKPPDLMILTFLNSRPVSTRLWALPQKHYYHWHSLEAWWDQIVLQVVSNLHLQYPSVIKIHMLPAEEETYPCSINLHPEESAVPCNEAPINNVNYTIISSHS